MNIIIKGGTVVVPEGSSVMDVGIEGEQIVAVAAPGTPVSYTHLTLPTKA